MHPAIAQNLSSLRRPKRRTLQRKCGQQVPTGAVKVNELPFADGPKEADSKWRFVDYIPGRMFSTLQSPVRVTRTGEFLECYRLKNGSFLYTRNDYFLLKERTIVSKSFIRSCPSCFIT